MGLDAKGTVPPSVRSALAGGADLLHKLHLTLRRDLRHQQSEFISQRGEFTSRQSEFISQRGEFTSRQSAFTSLRGSYGVVRSSEDAQGG
eukprot:9462653-Pyramimonas_sp.AAC.1